MLKEDSYLHIINSIAQFEKVNRNHHFINDHLPIQIVVLYILYGIHKQFEPVNYREGSIIFNSNDILLTDLLEIIMPFRNLYHMDQLYNDIVSVDYEEFETNYNRLLIEICTNIANNSNLKDDFFSPPSITSLMAYYINKENCHSVYDPFCGTASIVHLIKDKNVVFAGQEISKLVSLLARLNMEACYGEDKGISCIDSIERWNSNHFDAVVSCPPLGLTLSVYHSEQIMSGDHTLHSNLEELFFSRAFEINNANIVISLEPLSFCYSERYREIRKYLIERNYLDTIILLPEKLLYRTSIQSVVVICKKHRNENQQVKFINAESYCIGYENINLRLFHYDAFIKMIETNADSISFSADQQDIISFGYNLNPSIYREIELKEGQEQHLLGELFIPVNYERELISPLSNYGVFPLKDMKTDVIDIWLSQRSSLEHTNEGIPMVNKQYHCKKSSTYLFYSKTAKKLRLGLFKGSENFVCQKGNAVAEINEKLVIPEYLVYILVNHPILKRGNLSLDDCMFLPLAIDNIEYQHELIAKIKQDYRKRRDEEQAADNKRLGVKQNISDLEHMLGVTYSHMDKLIEDFNELYEEDKDYHALVKNMKDNIEYLKRVIRYNNATISSEDFNIKEQDIVKFINEYCNSWINYSGDYFDLSIRNDLGNNNLVLFDKALLRVLLDSILTNVERHGFDKRKSENNHVEISLSLESYESKSYVVMRVANNGMPFKKGFAINDYITRGRYSANTGRSGLGGYHVYQIVKGHNGYLYIDSNNIWNVIIEVLLPINNVESIFLAEYEHECI